MSARRTTLGAAAVLGLTLLAPTSVATAAGETCEGRPVTIVGIPEKNLAGTPGDDVILANGADMVRAGDGNDVVCVSSAPDGETYNVGVDAGSGDDIVVVVAAEGTDVSAEAKLGPGRDTFRGGDNEDYVEASLDDTLVVDQNTDYVEVIVPTDEPLPTTVGSVTGSPEDGYTQVLAPGRRVVMDGRDRTISVDGKIRMTIGVVPQMLYGVAQHVTLVGTPGDDRLVATACASATVRGRGGDDEILRIGFDAPPNRECPHSHLRASGGAGDDRIAGTINNDVLVGGPGNDRLKGRKGKDVARGGAGRDTCLAEWRTGCER